MKPSTPTPAERWAKAVSDGRVVRIGSSFQSFDSLAERDRAIAAAKTEGKAVSIVEAPARQVNAVAVDLGRRGGQKTSVAKAEAARLNGAKGGRPKKKRAR